MRFAKGIILGLFLNTLLGAGFVQAAVNLEPEEVKLSWEALLPKGLEVGSLEAFGVFNQISRSTSDFYKAWYQASLESDPRSEDGLPTVQVLMKLYPSQEEAKQALSEIPGGNGFEKDQSILSWDKHTLIFKSTLEFGSDAFGTVNSEDTSYHLVEQSGEALIQVSLYRQKQAYFDSKHLKAFQQASEDAEAVMNFLRSFSDPLKFKLAKSFPPLENDVDLNSTNPSSELLEVQSNGLLSFDFYPNLEAKAGTLLDSSGLDTPKSGDIYLYVDKSNMIHAGFYLSDSDETPDGCSIESGWVRLAPLPLQSYEWNSIQLQFGWKGWVLKVNESEMVCPINQARRNSPLYLGDYPEDSLSEGTEGFIKSLKWSGEEPPLHSFLDIESTDSDFSAFEWANSLGILTGENGYAKPDRELNRAEMIKILIKAYGFQEISGSSPYSDVPQDAWFAPYVFKAYGVGWLNTRLANFRPHEAINRAEFFTLLARQNGADSTKTAPYKDAFSRNWFSAGARFAYDHDLVPGSFFEPAKVLTRADAIQFLYQLFDPEQ